MNLEKVNNLEVILSRMRTVIYSQIPVVFGTGGKISLTRC
jgi:hypothetical protein